MDCPDSNVIQSVIEGHLEGDARGAVLAHAEDCAPCRALLAELVRQTPSPLAETAPAEPGGRAQAPRGTALGRFLIVKELGAGAMGVVVSAYDPGLDRRVAIKLLRAGAVGGGASVEARVRLVREAQAMAKLSHPNIITVHEVGSTGDEVFVVMEQVEGGTLASWLRAAPRSWRDVRGMFVAAGRGLAAAHAAGLVHRDFKPENVLVGDDGRVRVTDFGLVGVLASPATVLDPRALTLTRTGQAVGTPKYMAPEQHRGELADARADQFAFCVALYEGLFGARPFRGDTVDALAAEVCAGRVQPPSGDAPAWLRRAVLRGLAVDPDARHPSMDALLADLERDRVVARRRTIVAAAAVAAAAAAGIWVALPKTCGLAIDELAGVWDAGMKDRVRAQFVATGKPYAQDTFARVAATVDGYTGDWLAMHRNACVATQKGEQSAAALDLRMGCLARRLGDVRALSALLATADVQVMERSVQAVGALPDLAACADVERLAAPLPPPIDRAARTAVDRARGVLAAARARRSAGRYREGLLMAVAALGSARALGHPPLQAEAQYLVGRLEADLRAGTAAETDLFQAALAADAAHHDEVKADAEIALLEVLGKLLGRLDEALRTGQVAEAAVARLGNDPVRRAQIDTRVGGVLDQLARFAEACDRY